MHNIISKDQMAEWRHFEHTVDSCTEELDNVNDYFDCLIDCSIETRSHGECRRICREML